MRDHHGGHAVPACPAGDPAQRELVRDLKPVGLELVEQRAELAAPRYRAVVAAEPRGDGRLVGYDPALCVLLVAGMLTRDDQHRLVPGVAVPDAELAKGGAQAARLRTDEVGQPDNPHAAIPAGEPSFATAE